MKNKRKIILSSGTIEKLEEMAKSFFYSQSVYIEGSFVYNSKGIIKGYEVVVKDKRYSPLN